MKPKLLIVDDDEEIRTQMKWALCDDYEVILAEDRTTAVARFADLMPLVVLLDLGLPPNPAVPEEGIATLAEILAQDGHTKVIIITGQNEKQNALQTIGAGAYDYLTKPIQLEELKIILKRAFQVTSLEREYHALQENCAGDSFEGMLGTSPQMQQVFNSIRKVAATDASVLILGESGTGKEKAALAIHRQSARKDGPFIAINCGAIPESLLESELFGHEKGAFTGAHVQRKGRIEHASTGTLFLDEIGEIPLLLQVKLLRFLQEQHVERVGGRQEIQVNTRIIAATNKNLKEALVAGRFREDLYYRLEVVVLQLPPLRDRDEDVPLLAREFLRRYAAETGKEYLAFDPEALKALTRHSWPGNVRELENRVKRAVIMAEGKRLTVQDLELTQPFAAMSASSLKEARESVERAMVRRALRKHAGKMSRASAELGISRPTLYDLMDKLNIQRPEPEAKAD